MTPERFDPPPGGYKRVDDKYSQLRKVHTRYPAMFWALVAVMAWLAVLTIGGAVMIDRANDNTRSIRAGTCVLVTTLEVSLADARNTLKSGSNLTEDRKAQLRKSIPLTQKLVDDIRAQVICPPAEIPAADPSQATETSP